MKLSINEYKEKVRDYVSSCLKSNWINNDEANVILKQINNDILTIGVVGQMKVGKSTLINSLVFGDDILPTSEIPMTATLTYITYGEKFSVKVEMISESDFKELSSKKDMQASADIEIEEIKAAQELYEFICKVLNYESFLGKTIDVNIEQINNYIGAEGTFTPLAKVVSLFIPDENLKGINIVDTPGYNDPVSSRDMTTKKFLTQANVIVCVQDVLSVFTRSDISLIKDQIPKSGIGKIIIALNKKDSISIDDLAKVIDRAEKERTRLIEDPNNIEFKALLSHCLITPVSSVMAMIAKTNPETLSKNDTLNFFKGLIQADFPNLNIADYLNESGVLALQDAISDIVMNQKKELVLKAPVLKLSALLSSYINRCNLEKEHLLETNELLADENLDLESVLSDLKEFEKKTVVYTADVTSSCDDKIVKLIDNSRYSLRDSRNQVVESIKFEEERSKNYLRICFNQVEDKYRLLNITFSNKLRDVGDEISEILHLEVAKLERQLDQIVLPNSELIHKKVIKRIVQMINSIIPRTLCDNLSLEVTFPDYSDRCDIYDVGIRSYFRKMVEKSFSNDYINTKVDKHNDNKTKLIGLIEKNIDQIIQDTKNQFNANDAKDIEIKIRSNEERIDMIDKIIPQVNLAILDINKFLNIQ